MKSRLDRKARGLRGEGVASFHPCYGGMAQSQEQINRVSANAPLPLPQPHPHPRHT